MNTQPPAPLEPQGFFSGIRPWPVILGVIVDWVLTAIFAVLQASWFIGPEVSMDDEAALNAAYEALLTDPTFLLTSITLGALATVVGAFVGASRAGIVQLKHGLVIAVASGLTGLLVYGLPGDTAGPDVPVWYDLLGWLILIPAGILGGYLARQRQNQRPA